MKIISRILTFLLVMALVIPSSNMVFADVVSDTANISVGTTYTLPTTVGGKTVNWGSQSTTVDISKQGRQVFTGTTASGTATFTLNIGVVPAETPAFIDHMDYPIQSAKPAATPGLTITSGDSYTNIAKEAANPTNNVVQLGLGQTGWSNDKTGTALTGDNVTIKSKIKFTQFLSTGAASSNMSPLAIQIKNSASALIGDFYFQVYMNASGTLDFSKGLNLRSRWKSATGTDTYSTVVKITNVTISATGSDSWMNLKTVLNTTTKTYSVYVNDVVVMSDVNFSTKLITNDATLMNVQSFAFADRSTGTNANDISLIDDVAFYTGITPSTVYFNGTDFPTGLTTKVDQNTATTPSFSATLGLTDATIRTMAVNWTLPDTSKVGKFVTNGYIDGFNTPIPITVNVVKPATVVGDNMEGYSIGTVLKTSPWNGSNTAIVSWEDGTQQNKVFDSTAKNTFNIISAPQNLSGVVRANFRLKFTNTDFDNFNIAVENQAGYSTAELVISKDTTVADSTYGQFRMRATTRDDANVDLYSPIVAYGGVSTGVWINLSIVLDTNNKTYDVYYNNVLQASGIKFRYRNETSLVGANDPLINKLSLADRSANVATSTVHYFADDISLIRELQVASVANSTANIYSGDSASLPTTVTATLTDLATTQQMNVVWDANADISTVGTHNITGTVVGFDTPATLTVNVTPFPYIFNSLGLSDSSGKAVGGIMQNGSIDTVKVQKISSQNIEGTIYIALYDNNSLVGIKDIPVSSSIAWNKGAFKEFTVNKVLNQSNVENCTAKALFFGANIQPYSIPLVINNTLPPAAPVKIYIAGDSTATNYTLAQKPQTGWGEVLGARFNSSLVTVDNRALGGRSSMSFINEGELAKILNDIKSGDYLFVQFGHNDEKTDQPTLFTDPQTTYKQYLTQYIDGARAKGAIPILLTPIERVYYDTSGNIIRSHTAYQNAMKELALALKVPLIDMTDKSYNFLQPLGESVATTYYMMDAAGVGTNDRTHFNVQGANLMAGFVVQGIQELKLPIMNTLK